MAIVYESRHYVIESCRFDGESHQRYAVDRKHHHIDHNGRQSVGLHNLKWTDSLEEAMRMMQSDMAASADEVDHP